MREAFSRISRHFVHKNPFWTYVCDRYIRPDQTEAEYHFVRSSDSVLIIPQIDDTHVLVVKQYRYLQQRWGWEFPGGGQGDLTPTEAAANELREETGYTATEWQRIGSFSPCVGLIDEECQLFVAKGLKPGQQETEPAEQIECKILSFTEIDHVIKEGQMWSGMSQAAWMQFRLQLTSPTCS